MSTVPAPPAPSTLSDADCETADDINGCDHERCYRVSFYKLRRTVHRAEEFRLSCES